MANQADSLGECVQGLIQSLHEQAEGSIGDIFRFRLISCDENGKEIVFQCSTERWMANAYGTLHGGMSAAIMDQAMGFAAFTSISGEGITPTVQMQQSYHYPLIPGKTVIVRVHIVSSSRSLLHLSAELFQEDCPERLCVSGTSVYFKKMNPS